MSYPHMFFSDLHYPMQLMPGVMLDISHFTPLDATMQAIVYPMFGEFLVDLAAAGPGGLCAGVGVPGQALLPMGVATMTEG